MIQIKGEIGKYKILKKLGSGGFGTVYLAEDTILKTHRALKIPHRKEPRDGKQLQESILQTRLLDHPNIVKLLTVDIIDQTIIMVMEYIKGSDLEKEIDDNEKLPISRAMRYFKQILSALQFAHEHKVIHRDIRPSNILIDENDNVKITDFGTSTILNEKQFATTKIGSPPYMAPEQFEGRAGFASDIYSTGCLLYEMLTGFPPIVMANPVEIYKKAKAGQMVQLAKKRPDISSRLNWLVMKMLTPDLASRFSTIKQVIDQVAQMENEKTDMASEINEIQKRIRARETRSEHTCWNCRKSMTRRLQKCPYCGEEQ